MTIKQKIQGYIQKKKEEIQEAKQICEKIRAEILIEKQKKLENMDESAMKTLLTGVHNQSSVVDVMKYEYQRRKYERNQKYNNK